MNYMPREMRTSSRELRTKFRLDGSGLLFLSCDNPQTLLTFKFDSETLQDDITKGVKGLFEAPGQDIDDLQLIDVVEREFVWLVTAPAYERVLQVA